MTSWQIYTLSEWISSFFLLLFILKIKDFKTVAWLFYLLANLRYVIALALLHYVDVGGFDLLTPLIDVGFSIILAIVGLVYFGVSQHKKVESANVTYVFVAFAIASALYMLWNFFIRPAPSEYMWSGDWVGLFLNFVNITSMFLLIAKKIEGLLLLSLGFMTGVYYSLIELTIEVSEVGLQRVFSISVDIVNLVIAILFVYLSLKAYFGYKKTSKNSFI